MLLIDGIKTNIEKFRDRVEIKPVSFLFVFSSVVATKTLFKTNKKYHLATSLDRIGTAIQPRTTPPVTPAAGSSGLTFLRAIAIPKNKLFPPPVHGKSSLYSVF